MVELLSRLEALLITLLAALAVGTVAVLASAVPSMFASDADTRCWSSAVVVGSLWLAEQLVILSAFVVGAFALSRLLRSWFRQIPPASVARAVAHHGRGHLKARWLGAPGPRGLARLGTLGNRGSVRRDTMDSGSA
jgi:hypothetical protein